MTFVTPTLIAEDRTLVTVVQHEIAHSWTGNLVTAASWEHFWLNEGFTVFIENKLVGMFHMSEQQRQFECLGGWRDLEEEIKQFASVNQLDLTKLVPCLTDVDPDDAFSIVPYQKGHSLLFHLEEKLGGAEVFNEYLRAHIDKFKGQSINTDQWKAFLYEYFSEKKEILDSINWEDWMNKPGMPPATLKFDKTLANKVSKLAEELAAPNATIERVNPDFLELESNQKRELLSQLIEKEPLSVDRIELINKFYEFGKSKNSEILFRWIRLAIRAKWEPIAKKAIEFVTMQGRMKFTRPVYRDLFAWTKTKQLAIDNFKEQEKFMHQTTAGLVAKDMQLA